ncbi:MAG: arylsulfatase [Actinomycetota bacterium]|nr:arylsulfatase [Actinomycetota bacterium]
MSSVASNEPAGAPGRPNVVVILADDMGWGDLSCYGASKITTPAMDRVAAEGLRATDCHSASAVCSPSRYALLTGRYAWRGPLKRHVLFGHAPAIIEATRATLPGALQDAGYRTGAFGKWHLGLGWRFKDGRRWSAFEPGGSLFAEVDDGSNIDYAAGFGDGPIERGFDRFFGMTGSLDMQPYCFLEQDHTVGIPSEPKPVLYPQQRPGLQVVDWREDQVDVRFAEEACLWMREQASRKQPFFCYLALSAPHRPCMPPEFARGRSEAGPRGDLVWMVDWVVGQVTALLDELEIADNTLLIVTSDNGARPADVDGDTHGHLANGPWRGQKADIWEGGHREPFLARWPGKIAPGVVTDELISLLDLFPTIASACGVTVPVGAAEDALDCLPLLVGETTRSARTALVHHSLGAMFSLRDEEWKVIMGTGSGGFSSPEGERCDARARIGQLYHMGSDPTETANLWFKHRDVVARLYEELKDITRGPSSGLSFDVAV